MVRLKEEESKSYNMKMTQMSQNKVLRMLNRSRIKDRVSNKEMLEKFELMSVNQVVAQIKLTEAWKAMNDKKYPLKLRRQGNVNNEESREVRLSTRKDMMDGGRYKATRESFTREAGRMWNQAPMEIKTAKTLFAAKKLIKE